MISRRRQWRARALVATAIAAIAAASPAAAHAAAGPEVLVSADGVNFATELQNALFDTDRLLVPGESISASLWITNPAPDPALLRVSAKDVHIPSGWVKKMTVTVHDTGTGLTRAAPIGTIATCDVVVPAQVLAPGETIRTDIEFAFGDLTGTGGQNEQMHMNLSVAMRDSEAGNFPSSACDDQGSTVGVTDLPAALAPAAAGRTTTSGDIARTGGGITTEWLAAAALAIGAGLFLLTRRRRDREDDHELGARVRR